MSCAPSCKSLKWELTLQTIFSSLLQLHSAKTSTVCCVPACPPRVPSLPRARFIERRPKHGLPNAQGQAVRNAATYTGSASMGRSSAKNETPKSEERTTKLVS